MINPKKEGYTNSPATPVNVKESEENKTTESTAKTNYPWRLFEPETKEYQALHKHPEKTQYSAITYGTLVIGILAGIYALYVWMGIYSGIESKLLSLSGIMERNTGVMLSIDVLACLCGIVAIVLSNRKKVAIIGSLICFLTCAPLLAIYLNFMGPDFH